MIRPSRYAFILSVGFIAMPCLLRRRWCDRERIASLARAGRLLAAERRAAGAAWWYVPTVWQVGTLMSRMTPWVMWTQSELQPPAPPSLTSEIWSRDYEEFRRMGAQSGSERTEA